MINLLDILKFDSIFLSIGYKKIKYKNQKNNKMCVHSIESNEFFLIQSVYSNNHSSNNHLLIPFIKKVLVNTSPPSKKLERTFRAFLIKVFVYDSDKKSFVSIEEVELAMKDYLS